MLDLSHIPNSQQDIKVFYSNGINNAWQTWQKPRKCNYVWMMCIGGGGGGAGGQIGFLNVSSNPGGGQGAVTRALYNAQQLPDRLYIQVGIGGTGGGPGSTGNPGTRSIIALQPVVAPQNLVAISGNAGAAGGSIFTTTPGETAATQATATFFTLSSFISTQGVTTAQPNGPTAPLITPLTSQITCQGAAGAGQSSITLVTNNGGSIASSSISPFISGGLGAIDDVSNAQNGQNGITSWKPFYSLGGTGGGSAINGSGGNGGNGGIGSGGGGGGQSNSPGSGGKGGDGLVIIISF